MSRLSNIEGWQQLSNGTAPHSLFSSAVIPSSTPSLALSSSLTSAVTTDSATTQYSSIGHSGEARALNSTSISGIVLAQTKAPFSLLAPRTNETAPNSNINLFDFFNVPSLPSNSLAEADRLDDSISSILINNFLSGSNISSSHNSTAVNSLFDTFEYNSTQFPSTNNTNSSNAPFHIENFEKMIVIDQAVQQLPLPAMLSMLILIISKAAIIVGGAVPYIPQYFEIRSRKNASGFSLYVCLTLFAANILRIEFWIIKRFDEALFVQSIVMIAAMLLMLELSVRMNRRHIPIMQRTSIWNGDFFTSFWGWSDMFSYIVTLAVFTIISSTLTLFLKTSWEYVESLGLVSVLTEACLGVPQLCKNCSRRSTLGMNAKMVIMWLIGDVGKTIYYCFNQAPIQFFICSSIQITVDIIILIQVWVFGRRAEPASSRLPRYVPNALNSKTSI